MPHAVLGAVLGAEGTLVAGELPGPTAAPPVWMICWIWVKLLQAQLQAEQGRRCNGKQAAIVF